MHLHFGLMTIRLQLQGAARHAAKVGCAQQLHDLAYVQTVFICLIEKLMWANNQEKC